MQLKIYQIISDTGLLKAAVKGGLESRIASSAATAIMGMAQATHNLSWGAHFRPKPWPPLRDGRPSLLIRTGRMAHSYRVQTGAGWAAVTTDAPYAIHHQTGATIPPHTVPATSYITRTGKTVQRRAYTHPGATLPARPFLPIEESAGTWRLTRIAELMVGPHIERGLRITLGLI
jgi:phage gpG-like protein